MCPPPRIGKIGRPLHLQTPPAPALHGPISPRFSYRTVTGDECPVPGSPVLAFRSKLTQTFAPVLASHTLFSQVPVFYHKRPCPASRIAPHPCFCLSFFCCFVSGHRSYPGQQHCFFVRLSKHTRRTPFCLKYFVSHPFSLAAFLVSSRLVQAGTLPGTGTPLFHLSHIRSSYTSILTLPTQARLHFV